jgi:RHS repeat-associated protein
VGTAPTLSVSANPATNQQSGNAYDANGNSLGNPNSNYPNVWDVENRLVTTQTAWLQPITYTYDPWGRRVWKETAGVGNDQNGNPNPPTYEIYFYGATGQKLETYSGSYWSGPPSLLEGINVYFGGKLLQSKGAWVATDKLGSVRSSSSLGAINYFPYGEERTRTANGVEKFGTYTRDAVGQDYAEQRYYNSNMGAFWSPDPGGIRTTDPSRPSSWNRYAYVEGDPINSTDRHGLFLCAGCGDDEPDNPCDDDPMMIGCGGGGGAPPLPGQGTGSSGGGGNGCAPGSICIPAKAPPCAQNQALAGQALNNIVSAVGQVLSASGLSQSAINAVEGDLTANETAAGDVGFVGGHFNLILTAVQIGNLSAYGANVPGEVTGLFVGGVDGSASGVFGLGANGPRHDLSGGTSLHSQGAGNGSIDFHIDLGNPYTDVAGIIKHLGRDWLPPRMPFGRKPCLDAPFTSGGSQ